MTAKRCHAFLEKVGRLGAFQALCFPSEAVFTRRRTHSSRIECLASIGVRMSKVLVALVLRCSPVELGNMGLRRVDHEPSRSRFH